MLPSASADGSAPSAEVSPQEGGDDFLELPCVFAPQMQPTRALGDCIVLRFIQNRYRKLWAYARAQTCGAVAVRYQQGSYRRGSDVFALWPALQTSRAGGLSLAGLSLGLFECSVVTVSPFPLVRLGAGARHGNGDEGRPPREPAAIHARLRGLGSRRAQGEAVAGLGLQERWALLAWLAKGGEGGGDCASEVPRGTTGAPP